jgi:hypothetical protein
MSPIIIKIPLTLQGTKDPANLTSKTILPVTEIYLYLWKREHAKAQDCKDKFNKNMAKVFIIVYHQCSPTLKNDLEASNKFATIYSNQDVIVFLKPIQSLCCSYHAKTQEVMAMVASHKSLFRYYQKDGVDNRIYHCKFLAHVDTIQTHSSIGAVGVVPTFLASKIKNLADSGTILNTKNPTDVECALAVSAVREEYLAALMLSRTHQECFRDLQTDLKNHYVMVTIATLRSVMHVFLSSTD